MKVTTDPYTLVELLDKHGHVIGKATTDGNGNATIKPTTPIPEGEVTVRATDNAQHPNSSLSKPVKVTLADNDRAHKMVVVLTIQIKKIQNTIVEIQVIKVII